MQKQRITAMVCANASGSSRLPLLLIGTAKKPRCFKGMNMNALAVQYYAQKSAWMDQKIFTEWFKKVFVPYVQHDLKSKNLPQKAILVLDNAPAHPEEALLRSDDGNVRCYFLPANTTSLIQPMDQAVIETFKRRYRKKFIQDLVMEEDLSLQEYWKAYNLKNVVDNASDAWAEISHETLKKSWNKLWPESTADIASETVERDAVTNEVLDESAALFFRDDQQTINEWLHCDDQNDCYQLLTDEEIIELAVEPEATDSETDTDAEYDGSDAADEIATRKDSRKEAREAAGHIQQFIDWYAHQNDANHVDTMILRRMRNFAVLKSQTTVKQTKMTEFLSKS